MNHIHTTMDHSCPAGHLFDMQAQVHGLTVAFLDGTYAASVYQDPEAAGTSGRHYTQLDVQQLKTALRTLEGEVDVLLTCEWPRGVTQGM